MRLGRRFGACEAFCLNLLAHAGQASTFRVGTGAALPTVMNRPKRTLALGLAGALVAAALITPVDTKADRGDDGVVRFAVSGIEAERGGYLRCGLFRDEDNWLSKNPFRKAKAKVSGETATCVFEGVPRGTYAIASLHDEDGDRDMDTTMGLPDEGYCCSRDAEDETIFAPDWDDAVFHFDGSFTRQTADVKY